MSMISGGAPTAGSWLEQLPMRFRIYIMVECIQLVLTMTLFLCVERIFACIKKASWLWLTSWQSCLLNYAQKKYVSIQLTSMLAGKCTIYLDVLVTRK